MKTYIAFLRAVNVSGTGKMPMADLRALCADAGMENVRTYIASGNVIFQSKKTANQVRTILVKAVEDYAGRPVTLFVRDAGNMQSVLTKNPFKEKPPNQTVAIFLDKPPSKDLVKSVKGLVGEEIKLGACEVYVFYDKGMGQSKLKIPAAEMGTARNMNTIAKLVELSSEC